MSEYKGKKYFVSYKEEEKSFDSWDKLDPNMRSFVNELSEVFGQDELFITSGWRGKDEKSFHYTGNAIDIRPNPKVWDYLVNNRGGMEMMAKYGLNILDESDPEILAKTKGTGAHFHIGPDKSDSVVDVARRFQSIGDHMFNEEGFVSIVDRVDPYISKYSALTGTNFDFSKPVGKLDDISDRYSSKSVGMSDQEFSDYLQNMSVQGQDSKTITRILDELKILKEERNLSDNEKEILSEEQEFISRQEQELNRRRSFIQSEIQRSQMREEPEVIATMPQQQPSQPMQMPLDPIQGPNIIYDLS